MVFQKIMQWKVILKSLLYMDTFKELLWSEKWKRQKVTEIIAGLHKTFFWKLSTFYKAWEIPRSYCANTKAFKGAKTPKHNLKLSRF